MYFLVDCLWHLKGCALCKSPIAVDVQGSIKYHGDTVEKAHLCVNTSNATRGGLVQTQKKRLRDVHSKWAIGIISTFIFPFQPIAITTKRDISTLVFSIVNNMQVWIQLSRFTRTQPHSWGPFNTGVGRDTLWLAGSARKPAGAQQLWQHTWRHTHTHTHTNTLGS